MIRAFWASVVMVALTYTGFPLVLLARARLRPQPHRRGAIAPPVSVVIAARNEAASIGEKVRSVLAADYPVDRLEVVVVSDGSHDGTDLIVAAIPDRRVKLLSQSWSGKAAALEAGVAASSGAVLVFTDANGLLEPDAIRMLVRNFADGSVGAVAGNQCYLDDAGGGGEGERTYWVLDRFIKQAQSRAGDVISATGALYAIRRELFRGVPAGVADDFYISTSAVAAGKRLVFEPAAIAWEAPARSLGDEFHRKVRTMTCGLRAVIARRELLNPRRFGFYAHQLWWHKVLRRLTAVPLAVVVLSTPALWRRGRAYRAAAIGQSVFYAAGGAGLVLGPGPSRVGRLLGLSGYFLMVNVAALCAIWNILMRKRIDRWEPARTAELPGSARLAEIAKNPR